MTTTSHAILQTQCEGYIESEFWEQYLWTAHWSDGDIDKARETLEWQDRYGNSTWKDKYLKTKRTR